MTYICTQYEVSTESRFVLPLAFFEDSEKMCQIFPDFFSLESKIISCGKSIYLIYSNFFIDATYLTIS